MIILINYLINFYKIKKKFLIFYINYLLFLLLRNKSFKNKLLYKKIKLFIIIFIYFLIFILK